MSGWVTIHMTRNIYIRRSRVPLPKIHSSVFEATRIAYADETEVSDVEVVSALGGVEVGWITVLPAPIV